jgi:hypothetical protein
VIATFQRALVNGEADPCVTSVVEGESDLLCKALKDQDLFETVLQTPYPVVLCHSTEDTLVSFDNMPTAAEIDGNDLLDLERVTGGHETAGGICFARNLLFYVANIENYEVVKKHKDDAIGCKAPDNDPNMPLATTSSASWASWELIVLSGLVFYCTAGLFLYL